MLAQVPRDDSGLKILALDSPGGSVDAAFEMAAVMDSVGVSTVVPPGASCASACASILFVAGRTHAVVPGGRVGRHTCFKTTTRIGDEVCNDRIASFAVAHGTAYGSVHIFMEATPPDGIVWFSAQEADCLGLSLWPEGKQPAWWNQCVLYALRNVRR